MEQVRRWDSGTVGQVERTDQGYLRAPATITKTGVFAYKLPGGKIRRELRLPDEVFADAAMRSFGIAPLTNGHPPCMLNARNTARYQVGTVVEPKRDGDHVQAWVQVTDADAIEAAEAGRRQLSCGYTCALETKSGVTQGIEGIPDGLHFDAIQRNIRGNHVALVDHGRAGSTVQLRLDQADAFQLDTDDQWRYDRDPSTIQTLIFDKAKYTAAKAVEWAKAHGFKADANPGVDETEESIRIRQRGPGAFQEGSFRTIELAPGIKAVIGRPSKTDENDLADSALGVNHMETKITVDGVTFEVAPQVQQAVAKVQSRVDELDKSLADLKQKLETERARADAAEESLAAEKKAHADALAPDKMQAAVNARLALERAAGPILGSEVKLDSMADADIKQAVVVALAKDKDLAKERLDGCDAAYLQARYDAAIEGWEETSQRNDGLANARRAGRETERVDSADAARERMMKESREAGRQALKAS